MKVLVKKMIIFLIFLYGFACLGLYLLQDNLLFYPSYAPELEQILSNDPRIITLEIPTSEGKTIARISGTGSNITLYFGGNAENTDYVVQEGKYERVGYRFATLNYRGFGASDGKVREANMHEDALKLYDIITEQFKPAKITVIGRSLGTNIALFVATQRNIDHLVLVTPYDRIVDIAQARYPIFPVSWLIHDTFDSVALAKQVKSPTLVVLADNDNVVPRKHSETLLKAFEKIALEVYTLTETDHNTIVEHGDYLRRILGK